MKLIRNIIETETGLDLSFLDDGKLNAYGYGGTLLVDDEDHPPTREIDVKLRLAYFRINGLLEAISKIGFRFKIKADPGF